MSELFAFIPINMSDQTLYDGHKNVLTVDNLLHSIIREGQSQIERREERYCIN